MQLYSNTIYSFPLYAPKEKERIKVGSINFLWFPPARPVSSRQRFQTHSLPSLLLLSKNVPVILGGFYEAFFKQLLQFSSQMNTSTTAVEADLMSFVKLDKVRTLSLERLITFKGILPNS